MTTNRTDDVLVDRVVRAWKTVDRGRRIPAVVDLIKRGDRPQSIWRLSGPGSAGSAELLGALGRAPWRRGQDR